MYIFVSVIPALVFVDVSLSEELGGLRVYMCRQSATMSGERIPFG